MGTVAIKGCPVGAPISRDAFTSTMPFSSHKTGTSEMYDSSGLRLIDINNPKAGYNVRLDDRGRGNVELRICRISAKKRYDFYGCDKVIVSKTMKRRNAEARAREFIKNRTREVFRLPVMKEDDKNIFEIVVDSSQRDIFRQVQHCGLKLGKSYEKNNKIYDKLKKQLKNKYHWITWGETDVNVPKISAKKGSNVLEYFIFRLNR